MNIENITSDKMSLNYDGKTMQIKVYEDLLKKKDDELEQYKNNWEEVKKWLNEDEYFKGRKIRKDYITVNVTDILNKMKELEEDK